jgi:hypothetical protein
MAANQTTRAPTAFERLFSEYTQAGALFEIAAHHYFSTGAFRWNVITIHTDDSGFIRAIIRCPRGSLIDLFSYGIEDSVRGVGLSPTLSASDAETNMSERHQTNNEDFAIEGLGCCYRGTRINYPNAVSLPDNGAWPFGTGDAELDSQITIGDVPWCDLGAQLLPPEIGSPLALHNALADAIAPFVSLQVFFDRKAGDHICRLDRVPQAGAKSYLYANGEPSWHNYYRIPEGYLWRKSAEKTDRLLSIYAKVEQDVYATITIPTLWQPSGSVPPVTLGMPDFLWTEFSLFLIGRAFYNPSKNA